MKKINILINYKGYFETKHKPTPYEGGMDKSLIQDAFKEYDFSVNYIKFTDLDFNKSYKDEIFIYTSSEDVDSFYKDFIEDIILTLSLQGAIVIPKYEFLRSHNNKVFMELLAKNYKDSSLKSFGFGTIEELESFLLSNKINYPIVIKSAKGAVSSGVKLAKNKNDLIRKAKQISRSKNLNKELRDLLRKIRHKKYISESKFRRKFIIQEYVPELKNDWKVYFFGDKLYIWFRYVRKNDFRASGSGLFEFNEKVPIPNGLFDFCYAIYKKYDVPFISFDIAFDGKKFHLLEKQFLFFGKNGHYYSKYYYKKINNSWKKVENKDTIEKVYVESIVKFLK
tara:strand:- start:14208 stop:15221 length:1014 start_codon:yes stop_codon:yes gene_type:complete